MPARCDRLAGVAVPEADQTIPARRGDRPASGETATASMPSLCPRRVCFPCLSDVPDFGRAILAGRDHRIAIQKERRAVDHVAVAGECLPDLERLEIPELDETVETGREQRLPVGRDRHAVDSELVTRDRHPDDAGVGVSQGDVAGEVAGDDRLAVSRIGNTPYSRDAASDDDLGAAGDVPDGELPRNRPQAPGHDESFAIGREGRCEDSPVDGHLDVPRHNLRRGDLDQPDAVGCAD